MDIADVDGTGRDGATIFHVESTEERIKSEPRDSVVCLRFSILFKRVVQKVQRTFENQEFVDPRVFSHCLVPVRFWTQEEGHLDGFDS